MNQKDNSELFKEFILGIIRKRFKKSVEYREKIQTVSTLLSDSSPKLDGRVFYKVLKFLNEDIDKICKTFYSQNAAHILDSFKSTENRFINLISPFLNSQNQISESSQINSKRFNRLFAGELKELYADEVYGLAKAFDLKPSQLFNYFYGDGERPVVGV